MSNKNSYPIESQNDQGTEWAYHIKVTFPKDVKPKTICEYFKKSLKDRSGYDCEVRPLGNYKKENLFIILFNEVQAAYLLGLTAAAIVNAIENYKNS